jgi:transposase
MANPDQLSLLTTEPELIAAAGPPRSPLCRSLKRVLMPNRNQLELLACELDALLPEGHRARLVWAYVTQANLDPIYAGIKAVESGPGRAAIAPEVLFALWLYATLEGLGSARGLARATQSDDAYRWLCGGLQVNHHTLSDFRVDHGDTLDALLTASVAANVVNLPA